MNIVNAINCKNYNNDFELYENESEKKEKKRFSAWIQLLDSFLNGSIKSKEMFQTIKYTSNTIQNINDFYNEIFKHKNIKSLSSFKTMRRMNYSVEIKNKIDYLIECNKEELKFISNKEEREELKNNLKESLKNCFYFLIKLKDYNKPIITLSANNFFSIKWKPSKENCVILRFHKKKIVEYLFFIPNNNIDEKRTVLQGFTDIKEIFDLFKRLELDAYKI